MDAVITLEHRFGRAPDGTVWTKDAFPFSFWRRYLDVFDTVRPTARIRSLGTIPEDWSRADGPGVVFNPVPDYLGPAQYVLSSLALRRSLRQAFGPRSAIIFRIPSALAGAAWNSLIRSGRPYGVEVVGDPFSVFAPGVIRHPLRPIFRWILTRQQQAQCRSAAAAAYVTAHHLQSLYPASSSAFVTHFSAAELPDAAYAPAPRPGRDSPSKTLIYVGSLAQLYKGSDVLIEALARCVRAGLDLLLIVVGDGRFRKPLEKRAAELGLSGRVRFFGALPSGQAVRSQLDTADLFVLPSRTEGLPSALIEAMARGLPCLGSTVGGIPEVLPAEDMVPPGSPQALAAKICEVATDPERLSTMSARNLERARGFHEDKMQPRRREFFRSLKETTESWLAASQR